MTMTPDEFAAAIALLVRAGLRLPYGAFPGTQPDAPPKSLLTSEAWDGYGWNPPQHLAHATPDPDASRKPEWSYLLVLVDVVRRGRAEERTHALLRVEATRRISAVFGAETAQEEVWVRLAGGNTPERLALRDALLERYRYLRAGTLDLTADELAGYDARAAWEFEA